MIELVVITTLSVIMVSGALWCALGGYADWKDRHNPELWYEVPPIPDGVKILGPKTKLFDQERM